MIYKDKYYSALNDGHICTDGNWYPNDVCYKDYFTDEWVSSEQDGVVYLEDVGEYADSNSDSFEALQCTHCLEWYAYIYNVVTTKDTEEIYCNDCAEATLYRCEDCGEYFDNNNSVVVDMNNNCLCTDCYDNYFVCRECGCFVRDNEAEWIDEEFYCRDCAREVITNTLIKPYHYDMDYTPLTVHPLNEYYISELKLFGFEIEVECNKGLAERTLELLNGYAELQHDGSVDGFEIITKPMTKEFFYNVFIDKLELALRYLKDNGALAHNVGGIHIHFNKNCIEGTLSNSTLYKILHCPRKECDEFNIIQLLAQRKSDSLEQWASPMRTDRYSSIHYDERTDTHEIRIFNSNLRIERIIKNFEVLLSMIEYSNYYNNKEANLKHWLQWVMQTHNRYECLRCFIKEKNIDRYISNKKKDSNDWLSIFSKESEVQLCA